MKFQKNTLGASMLSMAVIMLGGTMIVVVSLMYLTRTERVVTEKAESQQRTLYNVTSLLEYGVSQVAERLAGNASLSPDEFRQNPLKTPSDQFFNPDLDGTEAEITEIVDIPEVTDMEIEGGMIPPAILKTIDAEDPKNQNDPDKGETVWSREVALLAKLTQSSSLMSDTTSYALMIFEIRDKPFFTSAVFSDGDLLIFKPNQIRFTGPIHTNGDLILVSNGGITFDGVVTTAGNIRTPLTTGPVRFRTLDSNGNAYNSSGQPFYKNFTTFSGSEAAWKEFLEDNFKGFVQDKSMGVTRREPFGFETIGADGGPNPYHRIIEPALPVSTPGIKSGTEAEKFASKASLVIKIDLVKDNPTYDDQETASLNPKSYYEMVDPVSYSAPYQPSIEPIEAAQRHLRSLQQDGNTVSVRAFRYTPGSGYYRKNKEGEIRQYSLVSLNMSSLFNPSFPADPNAIVRTQGPAIIGYNRLYSYYLRYWQNWPNASSLAASSANSSKNNNGITEPWLEPRPNPGSNNPPIKMWDARRRKWIHIVDIDIGLLKNAVESGAVPGWNGIVYIECSDTDRTGIRLVNAKSVPNAGNLGFTIATNNALYIQGSFNADGRPTGSSTEPDSPSEPPAAIAADAVTVLSEHWDDRKSRMDVRRVTEFAVQNQNDRNPPDDVEISAAILSGTGIFESGGINNFIRFLEMWEGKTVRLRGSLVSLFKSEYAWEPFELENVYYPPRRDYGLHTYFQGEDQMMPPGTPLLRSFVKVRMQSLTENTYDNLKRHINRSLKQETAYEDYRSQMRSIVQSQYENKLKKSQEKNNQEREEEDEEEDASERTQRSDQNQ